THVLAKSVVASRNRSSDTDLTGVDAHPVACRSVLLAMHPRLSHPVHVAALGPGPWRGCGARNGVRDTGYRPGAPRARSRTGFRVLQWVRIRERGAPTSGTHRSHSVHRAAPGPGP